MFLRPQPHIAVLWRSGSLPCAPRCYGTVFANREFNECMQMIDGRSVLQRVDQSLGSSSSTFQ